jgi:hypothetical protein
MAVLDEAIQAIRMGDHEEGRRLLEEILEIDDSNEQVWLWLCAVVDTDEDREVCLENVLALNPSNMVAQRGLEALRSGTFNVQQMMSTVIEKGGEGEIGETFLEEFQRTAQDEAEEFDDEELVMPSTMKGKTQATGKGKSAAKKPSGGGLSLNPRLIILAAVALLIICILGGVAASSLFLGGLDSGQSTDQQQTPAGGQTPPGPADTETPIPSDTPTPTHTPFTLPTPKPTDLPTPTATQVVPPTP